MDGKFDTIFVDAEKNLIIQKRNYLINIERSVKENIKKSYLKFYKANDITVDAAENFLEHQYKKIKEILEEKYFNYWSWKYWI